MKSFTTIAALAVSAALVRAQVVYNETTGNFTCSVANGTFCAGDSLSTNIIIRCNGFVGQPGNCDDNLDGEFPQGDSYSPCWASSPTSGIAACSKNCMVYGDSGNSDSFILPNCVPSATSSSSTAVSTSTAPAGTGLKSGNNTSISTSSITSSTTVVPVSSGTKLPVSATGGSVPWASNATSGIYPSGSGAPTSIKYTTGSGASTSAAEATSGTSSSPATATPISPPATTVSTVPTFTAGAANTAKAGSALAVLGLFAAYFL